MNLSEVLRMSGPGASWSPDGQLCAWPTSSARLEVRDAGSLQVLVSFTCVDAVQKLEWSPDSCYILTASYKRGVVEVWSILSPDWRCKINEGAAGLIKVCWAPDSRHIITTAEFHLQLTVWSLLNKTVSYIRHPKNIPDGLQFSPDQEYLAVAERRECKDHISIFETKSWHLVKNFQVATKNMSGLRWASKGLTLAVWDSPLQYKVLVYSPNGHCLTSYCAYQMALGVRTAAWSPSGQFLAVGSYDQKVRLLNHVTWGVSMVLDHSPTITSPNCVVYTEHETPLTGYPAALASARGITLLAQTSYKEEQSRPVTLALQDSTNTMKNNGKVAKTGIYWLSFSRDSRYLATRREDMPATIWIWSVAKMALKAVLVHTSAVRDLCWDPKQTRLALCTGTRHIYFWSPLGCVTVGVPDAPRLQVTALRWHPRGTSLALQGRDCLSVCFLDPPIYTSVPQGTVGGVGGEEEETEV